MNALAASLEADTTRAPYAAFLCDEMSVATLRPIVVQRGWPENMIFAGGIAAGVRMLGGMPCPEFLIVDLSNSTDPRADMQALADVCEAGTVVLAVGTLNDVTLYRDLLNAGVHDYLVKPLQTETVSESIYTAEEAMLSAHINDTTNAASTANEKIVFVGVRGGLGASTMAANVGWLMAERAQPTVLLDLDLHFGTSAMQFDLEPGRGLADALDNPERVDGLFLERAVVKPHKHLSILGSEAPVGSMTEPAEGALHHLILSLSENYKNVVVDAPRQILGQHSDILRAAKDIVLVTDFSLTAARDCIRLLAHIKQAAPDTGVHLVAVTGNIAQQEVTQKDFENSVEHSISASVPFDIKTTTSAAQHSKLVVDSMNTSKLAASYTEILNQIAPAHESATKKHGWLGKLMGKK